MGALYDTMAPGATGVLCTVKVTPGTSQVCATGNALRGNVVLEDAAEATLDLTDACVTMGTPDCIPSGHANHAEWVALGKPDCWCPAGPVSDGYQCRGDGDGKTSGFPFNYRIFTGDLSALIANWKLKKTDAGLDPCADYDRKSSGFPFNYQVFTGDLSILIANWKLKDADLTVCP